MKRRTLLTGFLFLFCVFASGQGRLIGYTYSIGIPSGSTKDYINSVSFRGVTFEGFIDLNKNLAAGYLIGWNVLSEKREDYTYIKDNLTVQGTQYRYMNLIPFLMRGAYNFGEQTHIRPYIGAGLGTVREITRTDVGLLSFKEDAWHFSVAPEIGLNIPCLKGAVTASARYLYGLRAEDLNNISYFTLNIGYLFKSEKTYE
jgi:hypothetical protein